MSAPDVHSAAVRVRELLEERARLAAAAMAAERRGDWSAAAVLDARALRMDDEIAEANAPIAEAKALFRNARTVSRTESRPAGARLAFDVLRAVGLRRAYGLPVLPEFRGAAVVPAERIGEVCRNTFAEIARLRAGGAATPPEAHRIETQLRPAEWTDTARGARRVAAPRPRVVATHPQPCAEVSP